MKSLQAGIGANTQEGIIMDDLAAFLGFKKSEKKPEKKK